MKIHKPVLSNFFIFAFLFCLIGVYADGNEQNLTYFMDIPEGFLLVESNGKDAFVFADPSGLLKFQINLYDGNRFASSSSAIENMAKKLNAAIESDEFIYQRRKAILAYLDFNFNEISYSGFACFIDGIDEKGKKQEPDYLLLAYVPSEELEKYLDFIFSAIDSFSIDEEALLYPGPISQYDTPWDPSRRTLANLKFGESQIKIPFDQTEAEASQILIEREYRVLSAYYQSDDMIPAAWSRFFRMIYRDNYHKMDYMALEISKYSMTTNDIKKLPSSIDSAKTILKWVQSFSYERNTENSDFINPLSAAIDNKGDCDSRALLMAILLKHDGIDAIVMVSKTYNHAMVAIDMEGEGAHFKFAGKEWLVCETTANVEIGQIAQSMSNSENWLGISLVY